MAECLATQPLYAAETVDIPGWNGGARSVVSYLNDCWFGFEVPKATTGAVVGLNDGVDASTDIFEVRIGFSFRRGSYRVIRDGYFVGPEVSYTDGDRFYIVRTEGLIYLCVRPLNGSARVMYPGALYPLPGEVVWVQIDPTTPGTNEVFLDASLWTLNDSIVDATSGTWPYWGGETEGQVPDEDSELGATVSRLTGRLTFDAFGFTSRGLNGGDVDWNGDEVLTEDDIVYGATGVDGELIFEGLSTTDDNVLTNFDEASIGMGELRFALVAGADTTGNAPVRDGYVFGELRFISALGEGEAVATTSAAVGVNGELVLEGLASAGGLISNDATNAIGRTELSFALFAAQGTNFSQEVSGVSGALEFDIDSATFAGSTGVSAGELRIVGFGYDDQLGLDAESSIGRTELLFRLNAVTAPIGDSYFFIPLVLTGDDGDPEGPGETEFTANLLDTLQVSTEFTANFVQRMRDTLVLNAAVRTFYTQTLSISEQAAVLSEARADFILQIAESLTSADELTVVQAVQLAEELVATGVVQTFYQASLSVLSAMMIADSARDAYATTISDSAVSADNATTQAQLLAQLLESMSIADDTQNVLTLFVEETGTITAADSLELTALYMQNLAESVQMYALFRTNAEIIQGWVMNTEGANPISEYDNYEFNSMAYAPTEMIGCNDNGLYVLDGDDDAGTDINAVLTSMMLDFETSRLKRMSAAWIGYKADGSIVLKVRTDDDGQQVEYCFTGRGITAPDAQRENRVKLGKGMVGRYWQFELQNVDGADFELDQVELYPIRLNRRV